MKLLKALLHGACIMSIAPSAGAVAAIPFPVVDQNPLTRGFYHPLPTPGDLQSMHDGSQLLLAIANTTNMNRRGAESMLVDVESSELRLLWNRTVTAGWRLRASLPVVHYDGGILDPVIDGFHGLFGLQQGGRPLRPDNQLAIVYTSPTDSVRLERAHTGIGDASIELGHQLFRRRILAMSAWTGLELPTGDARRLSGDGAVDAGAWLSSTWQPHPIWSISATIGRTWQGSGDLLADSRAASVGFENLTVRWDANGRLYLQAQLDAHGSYFRETRIPLLGPASVLTFGGGYRSRSGWLYAFSISEDIKVNASPDVVFNIAIRPPTAAD